MTSRERDDVHDSPTGWVARHVGGYVESDGKTGSPLARRRHPAAHHPRGRRTGTLRRTALIYDRLVVVASAGGKATRPWWFLNLVDEPEVYLQVGAERFRAMASIATGRTRTRSWATMVGIWPEYERYQRRTERRIPVVVLQPITE
ncbi:MAG TPA: nitroreductase/quinone reductase family protein [Actinomycetota bacterium]|nr:nitroreductase/quinone reductase family protein [Actinomycetota bacterium]